MRPYFSILRTSILLSLRLVILVAASALSLIGSVAAAQWSTTDLITNAPLPSGSITVNSVTVEWQVGNYFSNGLQIYGLLCTPASLTGPYPVAILNHGLHVPAIGPAQGGSCVEMAANGWLTAVSTYRGELMLIQPTPSTSFSAVSQGNVELCGGEVDDVLNLLSAVTAMPNAHPGQVLMLGYSHGSCITERAIEKGADVQIAVSIDGPTDFITWTNSPPLTLPEKEARSSVYAANNPTKLTHPKFLRVQAAGDTVVYPEQACELAAKIGSANVLLDSNTTPPKVIKPGQPGPFSKSYERLKACFEIPWEQPDLLKPGVLPKAFGWGKSPILLMYTGLNHWLIVWKAWPEYASFVNHFAHNAGWKAVLPAQFVPWG